MTSSSSRVEPAGGGADRSSRSSAGVESSDGASLFSSHSIGTASGSILSGAAHAEREHSGRASEKVSGRPFASLRSVVRFYESSNQHNTKIVAQPNCMIVSGLAARAQIFWVNRSLAVVGRSAKKSVPFYERDVPDS